ncbi:hypothetical protein EG19_12005 [Thermoanaerobaculum aquaticum]|uniref:Uncharacterized protein n=1 Tax=Thermoanaerobaculum aquaticum TaxID=1312852 RepID=A0A062XPD4_9BACT|nr:hypothetical protein [Thermoanaerobaculum aquaticum]KDA54432.1 hypothetical protein EG19_12005 [Thermoanaerobaculum aquaticum]
MAIEIAKLFLETVQKEFSFLKDEYGFTGPYSNFEAGKFMYLYKVWFVGKNLGVELVLEWRDQDLSCFVVRLEDGQMPSGLYLNEQGEQIRMYLASWLRKLGIQDPLFTRVKTTNFEDEIRVRIRDYAQMLRKYGQDVLLDRADIVFG